jgi:hypothetical protein
VGQKGYYDNLWRAVSELVGNPTPSPQDMRPVYREAVAAGVMEPGKPGSFALPPGKTGEQLLGRKIVGPQALEERIRAHSTHPSGLAFMVQSRLPEGASEDELVAEALRLHNESMQDPNTYLFETTPRTILERKVYGDITPEVLRASLLSADRPKLLKSSPILQALDRDRITRNLNEPMVIFRTPGLGYATTGPDGSRRASLGFAASDKNYMTWPRQWDQSIVPRHENAHRVYHTGLATAGRGSDKLLDSSPQLSGIREQYFSTWPEAQAEAAVLKQNHFMRTGKVLSNKADAEDFMQLLLGDAPKYTDPNPDAKFGPAKDKPIQDYNMEQRFWSDMMKKASQQDRDKMIELLPKVMDTTKPRTVV